MSWGKRLGSVLAFAVIASMLAAASAPAAPSAPPAEEASDLEGTGIETVRTEVAGEVAERSSLTYARSFTDPRDSEIKIDIRGLVTDRTSTGKMRYRINTEDVFAREDAPCMTIQAGLRRKAFRICGSGAIVRRSDKTKVGRAGVSRPTERSIVYTFATKELGPMTSFYRWRAVVVAQRCSNNVCDRSPNQGWITYRRRMSYGTWADSFANELDAPTCRNNRIVIVAWLVNEGTSAVWNPLATTYSMPNDTVFNSHGVKNYPTHGVGLDASRLTLERGWTIYDYAPIVRRLRKCANPADTARAIKRSSWCAGCTNGRYVIGLIKTVKNDLGTYARRLISTAR